MIGQQFGKLTVIAAGPRDAKRREVRFICRCVCGTEITAFGSRLRAGRPKSCGCLRKELKTNLRHGHAGTGKHTPTYLSWKAMHQRCADLPYRRDRKWYQGVTVCERWNSFENFLADMGERPAGHTLDRFPNPDGSYEPSNCRWATRHEQAVNRRHVIMITHGDKTLCLKDWARAIGMKYDKFRSLIRRGKSIDSILQAGRN